MTIPLGTPPPKTRRRGCLSSLIALAVLCVVVVYGVALVTSPWAFHIGGRFTPLLYWSGYGELHTKSGTYPVYVSFFPSRHSSRLRLDGIRPTGGLQGSGALCTSPGTAERLELSGTIYGGYRSTENSLMSIRVLERRKPFNTPGSRGYFDLYGRWRGPQLVMDDRGRIGATFRNGTRMDQASVTLDWGSYSNFKKACADMSVPTAQK